MRGTFAKYGSFLFLGLVLIALSAPAQETEKSQYLAPDEVTFVGTGLLLPWESKLHRAGTYGPNAELNLDEAATTSIQIDALHKLPNPGQWLFSVASASDLNGQLGETADPRDVIRFDGEDSFTKFFCGGTTLDFIEAGCNLDALYLDGDDDGDLIVSFTKCGATIRGVSYEAADLVRYTRPEGGDCNSWTVAGLDFDASGRVSNTNNAIAIARTANGRVMGFDVPADLPTSTGTMTVVEGQLALWDGTFFSLYENLPGWEPGTHVNAVALPYSTCPGLAGVDPEDGFVDTCAATWRTDAGQLRSRMEWRSESGALAYNVYRGDLGNTGSPACLTPDSVDDRQFVTSATPAAGAAFYYLVSGVFADGEGSTGQGSDGSDRPNANSCAGTPN